MARRALGPAALAVVQAVEQVASGSLLVACSGGADSLALAAAARVVGARRGLSVRAVVVDHGLQPGSDEVAARVVSQLAQGVADVSMTAIRPQLAPMEVAVVAVRVEAVGEGVEAAARRARYRALESAARGDELILLGHTLDDQAETVLLGLARGSGTRSLAGMPARRGPFVRPLLGLRRATTRAACADFGLEPWEDPHNEAPGFARARVRHRVLPVLEAELGPGIAEALARTAALARADADLLDELAAQARRSLDAAPEIPDQVRDDGGGVGPRPGPVVGGVLTPPNLIGGVLTPPNLVGGEGFTSPDLVGRGEPTPRNHVIPGLTRDLRPTGDQAVADRPSGSLDVRSLADLPDAIRSRVLRAWLAEAGARDLSAAHLQAVDALLTDWHGQGPLALPGVRVERRSGLLRAAGNPTTQG